VYAPPERYRLYTKPDREATGGIKGRILTPKTPIVQILAVPADEPRLVYKGDVSGPNQQSFSFKGLPMRKYDLVVIYNDRFYEGLNLIRGDDTLTTEDRKKINATIQKSEPYFTKRTIHRMEGKSGRGNEARLVATFLRDRASTNGSDFRRSFRLFVMKDVGPGWQVVRSRDLYPTWTKANFANPQHFYNKNLGRIRVTDSVKDVGDIILPTR
ncbi:MAG: hypothetical protein AAF492_28100, partial [Verrucomicrobiota bacterium]